MGRGLRQSFLYSHREVAAAHNRGLTAQLGFPTAQCVVIISKSACLNTMPAKKLSLFCAVCAIALVSGSWFVGSSTLIANDGRSNAAKPPQNQVEMVVAQAWWLPVGVEKANHAFRPLERLN